MKKLFLTIITLQVFCCTGADKTLIQKELTKLQEQREQANLLIKKYSQDLMAAQKQQDTNTVRMCMTLKQIPLQELDLINGKIAEITTKNT